jgi:S-DNA-T family DNA segregation ATPase FtsK/SpoIIIE
MSGARLLVADDGAGLTSRELARLMAEQGVPPTFVLWLGSSIHQIPEACRALVEISESGTQVGLRRLDAVPGADEVRGVPDLVDVVYAERVARALSGLEDAACADFESGLPDSAGLLECLGLSDQDEEEGQLAAAVGHRWLASGTDLAAPVGIGSAGVVSLDLREQGPHALVGGTSGSGKSELLRTWVAALAASHSPLRLNVLLIDFKGGTAFQDCVRLPHVVGLVTDLGEQPLERVRRSLLAELKRREGELARSGYKEFVDLQHERPADAPPALLVVFDEFEQLRADQPAFVNDVIVPIARLGRGLGVHLVLGTQRPQGAVPETIRANANVRVALRMLTEAESQDVVDAPDAAHIPPSQRGRAYVRLSHQSLVPMQAAFTGERSGAPSQPSVDSFPPCPKPSSSSEGEGRGGAERRQHTDFERLTDAICAAARQLGIGPPRRPWLPPLPEVMTLPRPAVPTKPASWGGDAVGGRTPAAQIGLVDGPDRQAQWPFTYRPTLDGNLVAYGGAGSGKSTLLRTLAYALAQTFSPSDLWLYGMDFSTGALRSLATLPHTGGVAAADEPERVAQLLGQLTAEASDRRRLRSGRDQGSKPVPSVVLLLDEMDSFRSAFERADGGRYLELLEALIREGRAVSIYCALTTSARRDLTGPLAASIGRRLLLRPGRADLEALGLRAEAGAAPWPPGRGLLDGRLEVQVAVLADGSPDAEAEAVAELSERLAQQPRRPSMELATAVTVTPDEVAVAALPGPSGPMRAVVGLGGDLAAPVEIDLLAHGHLVVAGPRASGRTTALVALAASLSLSSGSQRLVLMAAGRRTKLEAEAPWWRLAVGVDACHALTASLGAELGAEAEASPATAVIIDDGELLLEGFGDACLLALARLGRDLPVRVVAAVEARALRRYSEWLGELRESRQALLLNPDVACDGEPFGVGAMPRPLRPWPSGRAYLVRRGQATLVQIAH